MNDCPTTPSYASGGLVATRGKKGVRASLHICFGFHWLFSSQPQKAPSIPPPDVDHPWVPPALRTPITAFKFVLVLIVVLLSGLLKAVRIPIVSRPNSIARRWPRFRCAEWRWRLGTTALESDQASLTCCWRLSDRI